MTVRLLVADDHPIFRAGVRAMLDAQPGVQVVAEVEDAVKAAQTEKPDVVLIDVSMRGMNGLEATRRITAAGPMKVLCLSMHSDKRFVDAALRSGAHGYLLKDCALAELVTAIDAVVAGQVYARGKVVQAAFFAYR